jgi:hypothetical protein
VTPTKEAIAAAVSGWLAPSAKRPVLVIASAEAIAAGSDRLAALDAEPEGPIVLVLPDEAALASTPL